MSIKEDVIEIVAEHLHFKKEKVKPESSFIDDLGADSLDSVELMMELETAFDILISDDDAEKITTVGGAIAYIESRLK